MPFAIRRECACATRDGLVASSGEMTGGEKETLSQRALIGYAPTGTQAVFGLFGERVAAPVQHRAGGFQHRYLSLEV